MKTLKRIQKLITVLKNKVYPFAGYGVELCFRSESSPHHYKWFSIKFLEYAAASNWAEKVIERFEHHEDFPLDKVLVVELGRNEKESPEVIDNYFFPKKVYHAVIEICKLYHEGPLDTFIWQKACKSRQEAAAFIQRVGKGQKQLYSVNYAHIDVE